MKGQIPNAFNCIIEYLDRNLKDINGKVVITSPMSAKYPGDIKIGTIKKNIKKRYGLYQKAIVTPYINYFTLDNVFILVK